MYTIVQANSNVQAINVIEKLTHFGQYYYLPRYLLIILNMNLMDYILFSVIKHTRFYRRETLNFLCVV